MLNNFLYKTKEMFVDNKMVSYSLGFLFAQTFYYYTKSLFDNVIFKNIKRKPVPFFYDSMHMLFIFVFILLINYLSSSYIFDDDFKVDKVSKDIEKDIKTRTSVKKKILYDSDIKEQIQQDMVFNSNISGKKKTDIDSLINNRLINIV